MSAPPAGQTWRKYYYAGAQRVAMRVVTSSSDTLYFLSGDHLGSTSLTTSSTNPATVIAQAKYKAYGDVRAGGSGSTPTDYRFTGQRLESGFGLYDYGARYYDPLIGRFISADSLVPGAGNPQALNRFSYVLNSPMNYTDPSGHCINKDGDETRGDLFDCTVDELNSLDWNIRNSWIAKLGEAGGAKGWFDNIRGILDYFRDHPEFSKLNGYASTSDAGLLWAIQGGFRKTFRGQALDRFIPGNLWARFFRAVNTPIDINGNPIIAYARGRVLTELWGDAEIAGTAYGLEYAESKHISLPDGLAGRQWVYFKAIGDSYRAWQRNGSSGYRSLDVAYFIVGYPTTKLLGESPVWWAAKIVDFITPSVDEYKNNPIIFSP